MINECAFALGEGVGEAHDIDTGMVLGLSHPRGPLQWADAIGLDHVLAVLEALCAEYREERYRPAPALRRLVQAGRTGREVGAGFFEYDPAFAERASRFAVRARLSGVSAALPPFQRFLDAEREVVWRFLVASLGAADAEDCFQETFIAALRAYPRLRADSNLRAWVLAIAHRKALDAHRARGRRRLRSTPPRPTPRAPRPTPPPAPSTSLPTSTPAPSSRTARRARCGYSRRSRCGKPSQRFPSASARQSCCATSLDLPHREIAAAIGCSEDAARRSLHEGLTKLRKVVEV